MASSQSSLAPSTKTWNLLTDCQPSFWRPDGEPWPRLMLSETEWEQQMITHLDTANRKLYKTSKTFLKPPPDMDGQNGWYIDRFILQTPQCVKKMVTFLKDKGAIIDTNAEQLYHNRLWARLVWQDACVRTKQHDLIWLHICGRVAIHCGNGEWWNQAQIDQYAVWYNKNFGPRKGKSVQVKPKLPVTKIPQPRTTVISLNDWMLIDDKPGRRGKLLICPAATYLMFGFRLTGAVSSDFSYASSSDCKRGLPRTLGNMTPKPMFSSTELGRASGAQLKDSSASNFLAAMHEPLMQTVFNFILAPNKR